MAEALSLPENYNNEMERLRSFEGRWPLPRLDYGLLACTGMYYTGENTAARCNFCQTTIEYWEDCDDPVMWHEALSNGCPLLEAQVTSNVPINFLFLNFSLPGATLPMCFEEYCMESDRLQTFKNCENEILRRAKAWSDAGFFNIENDFICFYCGATVYFQRTMTDPWAEHQQRNEDCRYFKLMKSISLRTVEISPAVSENVAIQGASENVTIQEASGNQPHVSQNDSSLSDLNAIVKSLVELELEKHRKNRAEQEEINKNCKICLTEPCNVVLLPCGHVAICENCSKSLQPQCPLCRAPVGSTHKVFFS